MASGSLIGNLLPYAHTVVSSTSKAPSASHFSFNLLVTGSMLRKFKPLDNTDRFEFRDPDTGYTIRGSGYKDLYHRIREYRSQNGLPEIIELERVVESYLCGFPENLHKCVSAPLERGLLAYIKGGIALLTRIATGAFAPIETAERRAAKCVECKYNVFPDRGPFMVWADMVAEETVGDRRVSVNERLGNCAVCTCPLRSKVFHNGLLTIPPEQEEKMKEVDCWQLEVKKKDG